MKKLSLYVFLVWLFFPAKLYAKTFSWKDYTANLKKMQIKSKNMQALLNEMILKISEDCCEKNFQNKERLLLIKTNMNTCLEEDCHKKNFTLFYKKKPQKLLVLEQIEEAKNLLLKNSKLKYENEVQKKKAKRLEEIEAKRLEEIEAKRLEEIETKRLEEIETKLEETSIKDQEQTAKDDKKKAFHKAVERERAEKLEKLGITKRKKNKYIY